MEKINYNISSRNIVQFSCSHELNISPIELWHTITESNHLENYHPFCKNHKSEEFTGIGSKDLAEFNSGKIVYREVIEWDPTNYYVVKLTDDKQNISTIKFVVDQVNDSKSKLSIHIESNAYRNIPRPIWHFVAYFFLVPFYRNYLHSLLKGIEYFTNTGNKVVKNQFGRHRVLSP